MQLALAEFGFFFCSSRVSVCFDVDVATFVRKAKVVTRPIVTLWRGCGGFGNTGSRSYLIGGADRPDINFLAAGPGRPHSESVHFP